MVIIFVKNNNTHPQCSRTPRKLTFVIQCHFNPTRRNMEDNLNIFLKRRKHSALNQFIKQEEEEEEEKYK